MVFVPLSKEKVCTKCGGINDTRMKAMCRKCYNKQYKLQNKAKIRRWENAYRKGNPRIIKMVTTSAKKFFAKPENKAKNKIRGATYYKHKKSGKCCECGYEGKTFFHHIEYKVDSIKEVCRLCHLKEHGKFIPNSGASNE